MNILTIQKLSFGFLITLLVGCAQNNNYQQLSLTKETELQAQQIKTRSLAIAFGGGGLRGYMHLGVIKALENNNIKANIVTGTSAGSIAATLYASGQSYSQLAKIMNEFSEFDIMDFVISNKGIVNGQNLAEWVNDSIPQKSLSEMTVPIGITATDMTNLESVLIQDGDPGKAVQTSSTIPGVFIPVEHNGNLLVDGGVLNVVPVYYARSMGADLVIAIDIYCGNQPEADISSTSMRLATFRLLACKLSEDEINSANIVIRPTYEPEGSGLFSSKEAAINAGYEAMLTQIPKLKDLLSPSL